MRETLARILLLSAIVFASCEVKHPEGVIPPERMETLLYDYHLIQAMSGDADNEYKRKLYAEYFFDKNGITKDDFDSSMIWYTRNPKHLYSIYESLEKRLAGEVAMLSDEKDAVGMLPADEVTAMQGDTVDLWRGMRVDLLSATPLKNRVVFSHDADSTYRVGDSIVFAADLLFIAPVKRNMVQEGYMALVAEYADSSFVATGRALSAAGRHIMELPRNYDSEIKTVRGYIYYTDNDSLAEGRLLVGGLSLKRIHPAAEDAETEE